MNLCTAAILKYCDEADTSWILSSLLTDTNLENYYSSDMAGVQTDMQVPKDLLPYYLPKLHAHFVECVVDISPFAVTWFFGLSTAFFRKAFFCPFPGRSC